MRMTRCLTLCLTRCLTDRKTDTRTDCRRRCRPRPSHRSVTLAPSHPHPYPPPHYPYSAPTLLIVTHPARNPDPQPGRPFSRECAHVSLRPPICTRPTSPPHPVARVMAKTSWAGPTADPPSLRGPGFSIARGSSSSRFPSSRTSDNTGIAPSTPFSHESQVNCAQWSPSPLNLSPYSSVH